MPDSRIVKIHKQIKTLTAVNYGSGFSGVDMTGRVIRGSTVEPAYTPFACVSFEEALEEYGPTLGRFQSTAVFSIYAYIGGGDVDGRNDNALNLASDIVKALTNNRQLGLTNGECDDVLCSFTAIDGEKFGLSGVGVGYVKVEVKFQTSDGS